jgi:glyoxylase-like metal-dependent hydrolase (beta-lactamase superfamily II)
MNKKALLFIVFLMTIIGLIAQAAAAEPQAQPAVQKQAPQSVPLSLVPLKGGLYMVKGGSGANGGLFIGPKEVVVIDAKMTEDATRQELAEIAKLTPLPVSAIVLTHSDGDHVNGLSGFPKGLAIYGHENTKKEMEEAFKDPKMAPLLPYLPNKTIVRSEDLAFDAVPVKLLYFEPAHTAGNIVVFFPSLKIAFIGDLAFTGRDPLIHRQKGGTSFGYARTLKKMIALDAETYIAGHSEPLAKTDLQALLASIEDHQAKVKAMIDAGKSLEDIKKAFGIEEPPAQPGRPRRPGFIEVIYLDLTEKKI